MICTLRCAALLSESGVISARFWRFPGLPIRRECVCVGVSGDGRSVVCAPVNPLLRRPFLLLLNPRCAARAFFCKHHHHTSLFGRRSYSATSFFASLLPRNPHTSACEVHLRSISTQPTFRSTGASHFISDFFGVSPFPPLAIGAASFHVSSKHIVQGNRQGEQSFVFTSTVI